VENRDANARTAFNGFFFSRDLSQNEFLLLLRPSSNAFGENGSFVSSKTRSQFFLKRTRLMTATFISLSPFSAATMKHDERRKREPRARRRESSSTTLSTGQTHSTSPVFSPQTSRPPRVICARPLMRAFAVAGQRAFSPHRQSPHAQRPRSLAASLRSCWLLAPFSLRRGRKVEKTPSRAPRAPFGEPAS